MHIVIWTQSNAEDPQAIEQPLDLTIPENKIMLAFYIAAPEVENDRRSRRNAQSYEIWPSWEHGAGGLWQTGLKVNSVSKQIMMEVFCSTPCP